MRVLIIVVFIFCLTSSEAQVLTESNLPILRIDTRGESVLRETKINADLEIFFDESGGRNSVFDNTKHYDGAIGIEFRGSSSFELFEKKGYSLETRNQDGSNNNVSILGLPEENDWVLHGPYSDKTLMRNALIYCLADSYMEYTPRIRMVELIINDQYDGVYLFTEKIKRDKNRVDISKLNIDDNEGDQLTGGYILKFDKSEGFNSYFGIKSQFPPFEDTWQDVYFLYHYPKPEDITEEQTNYITEYIRDVEYTFFSENYKDSLSGYRKFIDVSSFVDFFISNELSKNPDAYRLSSFLYKDRDSINHKLKAGPIWDFNLGFGNVNYCTDGNHTGFVVQNFNKVCPDDFWVIHFWWERLLSDPYFRNAISERWIQLRNTVLSDENVIAKIDSFEILLDESRKRNFRRYPIIAEYVWPNYTVESSYSEEVERLRSWTLNRMEWIDNNLGLLSNFSFDASRDPMPKLYPNPINDNTVLEYYSHLRDDVTINIFDGRGQVIFGNIIMNTVSGLNYFRLPIITSPGIYFCELNINGEQFTFKFIK